ncbi:hypothetical protein Hsero_1291 [Herbaspirillum seropedicae SmR1]|uniref:Uncharacterized protein n=1 Tax=Herbaspirillum seropedicae (strain SmR1) TaxID=757424 RepID=D8INY7_HERSS|nr:hypothetical protein Hsero_1291 [Herbaspirillum seropedicae SmR1]
MTTPVLHSGFDELDHQRTTCSQASLRMRAGNLARDGAVWSEADKLVLSLMRRCAASSGPLAHEAQRFTINQQMLFRTISHSRE